MSGLIAKSQVPTVPRAALPLDVQLGIIHLKNNLRAGVFRVFGNRRDTDRLTGKPLPKLSRGCIYIEGDVGRGRIDRGERRLVAEIVEATRQVRELYFTDDHYDKFSFVRIV